MEHGLGRLASSDPKDANFLMASRILELPTVTRRFWIDGLWFGDQGRTSRCVEYAWHHWVQAWPTKPRGSAPYWPQGDVYDMAQKVDEWEGEGYDGTSVRAGAKVLQSLGYIESYHWAWDLDTMVNALLTVGPVVVGTTWYRDMTYPNARGYVKVGGPLDGGHAYLATGVNTALETIRFKNSWGRSWGRNGRFYMSFSDFDRLLQEDGEACLAVETVR